MSTPRKHHFGPRFYLGAFMPCGKKDANLFVFDKQTGKQWPTNPRDAGRERDLYMVDVNDNDHPLTLEKPFSRMGEDGAETIRFLRQEQRLPFDDAAVLEYWWHVARIGTVTVPGGEIRSRRNTTPAKRPRRIDSGSSVLRSSSPSES